MTDNEDNIVIPILKTYNVEIKRLKKSVSAIEEAIGELNGLTQGMERALGKLSARVSALEQKVSK